MEEETERRVNYRNKEDKQTKPRYEDRRRKNTSEMVGGGREKLKGVKNEKREEKHSM